MALSKSEATKLTQETVGGVKHLDCRLYDACLDIAVDKNWPGFSCRSCKAYQAMDIETRVKDHFALVVLNQAADNLIEIGKPNRKRGARGNVR